MGYESLCDMQSLWDMQSLCDMQSLWDYKIVHAMSRASVGHKLQFTIISNVYVRFHNNGMDSYHAIAINHQEHST